MPQLDFATFFSQIFWLFCVFFGFYFLFFKSLVPLFSLILKVRFKKLKRTSRLVSVMGDQNWYFKDNFDKSFLKGLVNVNSFLSSFLGYVSENADSINRNYINSAVLSIFVNQACKSFSCLVKFK